MTSGAWKFRISEPSAASDAGLASRGSGRPTEARSLSGPRLGPLAALFVRIQALKRGILALEGESTLL